MKKKKYGDINHNNEEMYVYCEMKATGNAVSDYIYYLYCDGESVLMDKELDADDVRRLISCLTAALKALFDYDTNARNFGMRRLDNLAQAHCRAAVGEKIVDNQHIFARL